ncbi:extracellular solute-binding protein [Paenibacillus sepulcri]
MSILLKGMTWNHTRGYLPMVATSQRYSELHPEVQIQWEKRSLQQFADMPLQQLVDAYDLLVIDHPWAGYAAEQGVLLPLNLTLSAAYMQDQAEGTVGASHASYQFHDRQTALAIDAATPVASWRPDLLAASDIGVPETWEDVLALAGTGKVAFPAIAIDSLMNFYMFCLALGETPFLNKEYIVSRETGILALDKLRELAALCSGEIFGRNPIATYEAMAADGTELAYCPFAYGYSNYSRRGYAANLLEFGDLAEYEGKRLQSTLGGTGLAVSSSTRHKEHALAYAAFAADPLTQRTLFTESGGQPGHRSAWLDEDNNKRCLNYFGQTLPALDRAFVRPRYNGYLAFQDHAGDDVRDYMMNGGNAAAILEKMNGLYRDSQKG